MSVMTDANPVFTILGFLPIVLAAIIFLFLLENDYKDVLFWLVPVALCILFLAIGPFLNELIDKQLDIFVLTAINLIISYIVLAIMFILEYTRTKKDEPATLEEVKEFKDEDLGRYLRSIEDKCKALNFVIGRVYRASNGGVKTLRERINIPREWYNEFNEIPKDAIDDQRALALDLLTRIHDRLSSLLQPEKDVFDKAELALLKNLARDEHGRDRILDVLVVNDNDPVEEYFLGAMDFCKRVKGELEKPRKKQ